MCCKGPACPVFSLINTLPWQARRPLSRCWNSLPALREELASKDKRLGGSFAEFGTDVMASNEFALGPEHEREQQNHAVHAQPSLEDFVEDRVGLDDGDSDKIGPVPPSHGAEEAPTVKEERPGSDTGSHTDGGDEESVIAPEPPRRTRSSASSKVPELIVVPRSERRGLLARLAFIPEVRDAYAYTNRSKWIITAVVAAAAVGGPMGTSIFYRKFVPWL